MDQVAVDDHVLYYSIYFDISKPRKPSHWSLHQCAFFSLDREYPWAEYPLGCHTLHSETLLQKIMHLELFLPTIGYTNNFKLIIKNY